MTWKRIARIILVISMALAFSYTQLHPKTLEAKVEPVKPLGFWNGVIENYATGNSNCAGRTGSWTTAVCMHNAIIRWSGLSKYAPSYKSSVDKCYYRWQSGASTRCYYYYMNGQHNEDDYLASVANNSIPFGHAIVAKYDGGGMSNFNNWTFFQYNNYDIKPGDWQMPCGTSTERTQVKVTTSLSSISCRGYATKQRITWEIDKNCNVTYKGVSSQSRVTDPQQVEGIQAEIEKLEKMPEMQIAGWTIDPEEKRVDLWVNEFTPKNRRIQIGGWAVKVWEDQRVKEGK